MGYSVCKVLVLNLALIECLRYRLMLMIAQRGGPQISKKLTSGAFPRFGREIEHALSESRVASDE